MPPPDGILLWTRVTPTPDAVPGSGRGADTAVRWEVAEDKEFARVVARGATVARTSSDHTVKADVRGLSPATAYWFRFSAGDGAETLSPTGRTRTAPAARADTPGVRFGVVSCANWEAGCFSPYRHLAARADLDAVLHLGDYIYEYASGSYPDAKYVVRQHEPAHEILTLADYRIRHGRYKTDADLQTLHATHPVIAIWDDHEFANDAWSGGAENHTPDTEGAWTDRAAGAKQAYFEWMPVRASTEGTVYRRLRFGTLADLHLLDLRTFRSQQATIGNGSVDDPDRSITGRAQLDWLKAGLAGSDATWKLVGTSVMISPVAFGSVPAHLPEPLVELLGLPKEGLAVNVDQWDGYTDDRKEMIAHLRDRSVRNTVFLTGDIHMAWADDVPVKAARTVSVVAAAAVKAANRHMKWVDMDSHGYGVLDVTAERSQMDYYAVSDKTKRDASSAWTRSYRTLSGTQKVERVDRPVH